MYVSLSSNFKGGLKKSDAATDKYDDSTKQYDQTVSLDGKVVSRISTGKLICESQPSPNKADTSLPDSGVAQGWGTATECQAAACGSYAAHEYIDTKIVMDVADPDYAETKGTTGASGDLVTADGGKTWTVESIKIEAGVFD